MDQPRSSAVGVMKTKKRRARPPGSPAETRTAEVATVGWMLAMVTALACEVLTTLAKWYVRLRPNAEVIQAVAELLFFAALVTGLISLIAAAAAFRLRQTRPPTGITVLALAVGVAPLVALGVRLLF